MTTKQDSDEANIIPMWQQHFKLIGWKGRVKQRSETSGTDQSEIIRAASLVAPVALTLAWAATCHARSIH